MNRKTVRDFFVIIIWRSIQIFVYSLLNQWMEIQINPQHKSSSQCKSATWAGLKYYLICVHGFLMGVVLDVIRIITCCLSHSQTLFFTTPDCYQSWLLFFFSLTEFMWTWPCWISEYWFQYSNTMYTANWYLDHHLKSFTY